MLRYRLRTLLLLPALGPPTLRFAWSPSAVPTEEPAKRWDLTRIAVAAPPRSDDGPTHILAWKIVEDDRPWCVESCLVLKQLQQATKDQGRWMIASLTRVPAEGSDWDIEWWWYS